MAQTGAELCRPIPNGIHVAQRKCMQEYALAAPEDSLVPARTATIAAAKCCYGRMQMRSAEGITSRSQ